MTGVTDLAKFREGKQEAVTPQFVREVLRPRLGKNILAIDQSLGNAGWAAIQHDGKVLRGGNLKTFTKAKGHEATLIQGTEQFEMYLALLDDVDPALVVHETPPVSRPGMKMSRPESSLVSANALRNAAAASGIPVVMVGAQKAKNRFTGNPNADKKVLHEVLYRIDATLVEMKPMNEGIRDAIAIGWVALEEEQ